MKSSKLLSSLWGNKLPRVLVANRGEIAIRISSALSELGAQSIGLYSEADAHSLHRFKFQESLKILPHYLNESPSAFWDVNSYLDVPAIISLAKKHNIQMIHPGYGFLSENEEFAQACKNEGITFIGPKPETIKLLGDKINARLLAKQVNVPVLPGLDAPISSVSEATSFIKEVGFPLIIKAVHGGGGKGIRVVHRLEEFEESFARCVSEAKRAFGNGEVFIEKFIDNPRHIEVQILGDSKGHLVHLFERVLTKKKLLSSMYLFF